MWQQHWLKLQRRISSHVLWTFFYLRISVFLSRKRVESHQIFLLLASNERRYFWNFTVWLWQYIWSYNADWYKTMEKLGWNGKGKLAGLQQRMARAVLWGGRRGWMGEFKTSSKRTEPGAIWWRGSWIRFQTQNISRILQLQDDAKNIFYRDWWNEK